jgi:hypothetical protein
MKKLACLVGLICAIAALTVAPSASAAIRYKVCHGPAPVRNAPESSAPVIGYAQNGDFFEATQNSKNNFDLGYVNGKWLGYLNRNYYC